MIRDITLGQYYNVKSLIHMLDPRIKIITTFVFLISLFISTTFFGYIFATIFLLSYIFFSKVPFDFIFRGFKTIIFLLLISVIFNMLFTKGEVVFRFSIFVITKEGIIIAIKMAVRLIYLVVFSSILTLTTTPTELTNGLEEVFSFMKIFKIPVAEIALMMSISLRFIPILIEETDRIMKAQMSRGADFDKGNIIDKAKSLIPLILPLFVSAFRRANDLALAMEARCYSDTVVRTKLYILKLKKNDYIMIIILLIFFILMFVSKYI